MLPLALARRDLPDEDFQIGRFVVRGRTAEHAMTEHWLRLADPAIVPPGVSFDS